MSRQELADEINAYLYRVKKRRTAVDANYVGKLERGIHRWPNQDYRQALRVVLKVPDDGDLGFYVARPLVGSDLEAIAGAHHYEPLRQDCPEAGQEARRGANPSVSPRQPAFQTKDLSGRAARFPSQTLASDAVEPDADVHVMRSFRAADLKVGGGHLYPTVVRYLNTAVARRLFTVIDDGTAHGGFASAAALTEMAGWLAHDAGRDNVARQHLAHAYRLSCVADDRQLCAHVLASRSHLADHLNQPHQAVSFAQAGQETLEQLPGNPGLAARLLAMEARGSAALGKADLTRSLLNRAERALDQAPSERPSPWVSTFDEASLASEAVRCLRQLGELGEARRQAERIVALRGGDRVRSRSFGQLSLASLLIAERRVDEACAMAIEALDATRCLGSYLVIQQFLAIQTRLQPYQSSRDAAEFLASLRDALHERLWLYRWMSGQSATDGAGREW